MKTSTILTTLILTLVATAEEPTPGFNHKIPEKITADSNPPNTIVLDELVGNYQYNAEASKQTKP